MLKHLQINDLKNIIGEAEKLNDKHPPSPMGINAADITAEMLETYSRDCRPLEEAIAALSQEARFELMAVMWTGRGDSEGSWETTVDHARGMADDGDVNYIAEKHPALPLYLRDGCLELGIRL